MAVWPFCRPCPRTSVTVMPGMFIFSRASRTSSTLFGRRMLLINFMMVSPGLPPSAAPCDATGGKRPSLYHVSPPLPRLADVLLARPDVVAVLRGNHEHAPVANLPGTGGLDDGGNDLVGDGVRHHHFNLDLRQQRDVVLPAPIYGRVPLLTT